MCRSSYHNNGTSCVRLAGYNSTPLSPSNLSMYHWCVYIVCKSAWHKLNIDENFYQAQHREQCDRPQCFGAQGCQRIGQKWTSRLDLANELMKVIFISRGDRTTVASDWSVHIICATRTPWHDKPTKPHPKLGKVMGASGVPMQQISKVNIIKLPQQIRDKK